MDSKTFWQNATNAIEIVAMFLDDCSGAHLTMEIDLPNGEVVVVGTRRAKTSAREAGDDVGRLE